MLCLCSLSNCSVLLYSFFLILLSRFWLIFSYKLHWKLSTVSIHFQFSKIKKVLFFIAFIWCLPSLGPKWLLWCFVNTCLSLCPETCGKRINVYVKGRVWLRTVKPALLQFPSPYFADLTHRRIYFQYRAQSGGILKQLYV